MNKCPHVLLPPKSHFLNKTAPVHTWHESMDYLHSMESIHVLTFCWPAGSWGSFPTATCWVLCWVSMYVTALKGCKPSWHEASIATSIWSDIVIITTHDLSFKLHYAIWVLILSVQRMCLLFEYINTPCTILCESKTRCVECSYAKTVTRSHKYVSWLSCKHLLMTERSLKIWSSPASAHNHPSFLNHHHSRLNLWTAIKDLLNCGIYWSSFTFCHFVGKFCSCSISCEEVLSQSLFCLVLPAEVLNSSQVFFSIQSFFFFFFWITTIQ